MRDIPEAQKNIKEEARQQHAEGYRKILKRVIDTFIFLGKLELAFVVIENH